MECSGGVEHVSSRGVIIARPPPSSPTGGRQAQCVRVRRRLPDQCQRAVPATRTTPCPQGANTRPSQRGSGRIAARSGDMRANRPNGAGWEWIQRRNNPRCAQQKVLLARSGNRRENGHLITGWPASHRTRLTYTPALSCHKMGWPDPRAATRRLEQVTAQGL